MPNSFGVDLVGPVFKVVTNARILFDRGLMGTVVSLRFPGNVSYM